MRDNRTGRKGTAMLLPGVQQKTIVNGIHLLRGIR